MQAIAPISVMFIQGTQDPIVHIQGGIVGGDHGRGVSLADAVKFWRDCDGISAPPISTELTDNVGDGTHVYRDVYGGGKPGTEVIVYTIEGGGHIWPGGIFACISGGQGQSKSRCHASEVGIFPEAQPPIRKQVS
jgi:polyhydroxybutyrate depolymerase